jgi:hypothetical protein
VRRVMPNVTMFISTGSIWFRQTPDGRCGVNIGVGGSNNIWPVGVAERRQILPGLANSSRSIRGCFYPPNKTIGVCEV